MRWPVLAAGIAAVVVGCGGAEPSAEPEHDDAPEGPPAVTLDSLALAMTGIQIGIAESVATNTLPVTGTITYDVGRLSHVGTRSEGRLVAIRAELGDQVRRGQSLAVLESAEVGTLRAELAEARALLAIARENHGREERLEEQGVSSRRELLEALAELNRAEAAAQSAGARLRALGAANGSGAQFAVTAPLDGVVVEKQATLGQVVGPSDQLYTIADLSRVWIELDVFERDLPRIGRGQAVTVTTAAYPARVFSGRIVYVSDVLDPETRAVRARIEVENPDRALKPGMFARASIEVGEGSPAVAVPRDAVQTIGDDSVVWVPAGAPGAFRARTVAIGETLDDGRARILAGLAPGDSVVVEGAFTLKAELSKAEFGGHGH